MPHHVLTQDQANGSFSALHEPVLRVRAGAGDRITFRTDDLAYAQMEETRDLARVTATINPVTGPVFVDGAEPGDALAVTIHDIDLAEQGWSVYIPGAGALAGVMGGEMMVRRVPVREGRVHLLPTLDVPVAPMLGCIGVAPSEGDASTVMPSYPTGGNMDLTYARPGATVLLPVQVPGALLSIGDIEIAGAATVSVDVVPKLNLAAPQIDTGAQYICVGLGDPVQDSVVMAYESMFVVLTGRYGFTPEDAYVVMSAVAHTELGGPTGSVAPDPLHPLRAVGAVTVARISTDLLSTSPAPA